MFAVAFCDNWNNVGVFTWPLCSLENSCSFRQVSHYMMKPETNFRIMIYQYALITYFPLSLGILPMTVLIPGLFFIPESPRWLVRYYALWDAYFS